MVVKKTAPKKAPAKKRAITRPSQITKEAPSKRLVARRKVALIAPKKGYWPNPEKRYERELPYHVDVSKDKMGAVWHGVAEFEKKNDAVKYARELAKTVTTKIRVVKV